jgi:GNAT superfamily N-acetyltransferase
VYINIGRLGPDDRADWQRLFEGYNAFYKRTLPQEVYDRAWAGFQAGARIHALGARIDGRLIGITHFLVHPNTITADVCYLQDLFTAEEARGRGVGQALIEAVAQWARERGCAKVYWQTHEDNETARRLYDRLAKYDGFVVYRLPLS